MFYRQLNRDRAFQRASALAYGTLISLVPMLMLVFAVLDAAGLLERDSDAVTNLVFGTFLGDIPEVREVLLPGLMRVNLGAIGAVGTIGWLWVSARIYMTMEESYCDIFGVPVNRSFTRRLMNFYLTLTMVPLAGGLVSFGSHELATGWGISWWGDTLRLLVPSVLLTIAIKVLPATRVRWGPAIAGGLASGFLVEAGVRAFGLYVKTFAANDPLLVVYGSIGIIPVFLLWIWLLWVFVLLGVEVAAVGQNYRSLVRAEREQREAESERLKAPSLETALEVAAVVASRFKHGLGPASLDDLAARCRLPAQRVEPVLEVMQRGGVLARAQHDTWVMARPPADLTLRELGELWREATSLRRQRGDALDEEIREALDGALQGTLEEAAERWVRAEPEADAETAS